MPRFSEDSYIDFCVIEALAVKAANERQKAEKEREVADWKKGAKNMAPTPSGKRRI